MGLGQMRGQLPRREVVRSSRESSDLGAGLFCIADRELGGFREVQGVTTAAYSVRIMPASSLIAGRRKHQVRCDADDDSVERQEWDRHHCLCKQ